MISKFMRLLRTIFNIQSPSKSWIDPRGSKLGDYDYYDDKEIY